MNQYIKHNRIIATMLLDRIEESGAPHTSEHTALVKRIEALMEFEVQFDRPIEEIVTDLAIMVTDDYKRHELEMYSATEPENIGDTVIRAVSRAFEGSDFSSADMIAIQESFLHPDILERLPGEVVCGYASRPSISVEASEFGSSFDESEMPF